MFRLVLIILYLCLVLTHCEILNTIVLDLPYSSPYAATVNKTVEYILIFSGGSEVVPSRVTVLSENATSDAPLMIVAAQPKNLLSWNLPMSVESSHGVQRYMTSSRTLCLDMFKNLRATNRYPIVTISTASERNVNFVVVVDSKEDFQLLHSVEYNITISPSEPQYFFYNFTTNLTDDESNFDTVILMVTSQDSICTVVSIQNVSCPVFDLNEDITFRGFYETFDMRGGITIPKDKFPYGFFVVFVAKADDSQCSQTPTIPSSDNRTKSITVEIKPSISYKDYTNAVIWTLCSIGAFYVVFAIAFALCTRRCWEPRRLEYAEAVVPTNSDAAQTRSLAGSEDSESIDEVDSQRNFPYDRETRRCKIQPCLEDLALRHPRILAKKSYLYLYNVLTVGLFYALPVVQLVVTYQGVLNETGQQDLCYYNFLCSHPLGVLSDFNHVFSNVGYVLLGLLFLAITFFRERTHCDDADFDRHYGIPQHYGLFYAMGVALIMEGVLSGSYHVCPSQSNFQFDTSFMYVMAVLCMIKLYQNRHPDINANAYATFGVLAVAILLGMIGLFEGTESFWMFFAVVHILSCLYLSLKVYYMGCWSISTTSLTRMWHTLRHDFSSGPLNVFVPSYKARFCVLLFANACNWALAYVAVQYRPQNFAVFLLLVFMSNTLLYFIFYIVMKYVNKERVRIVCWIFLIASTLCAISAMYFFLHKSISWSATPAKSRHFNTECTLLRFYDYHDVWHFLSAVGMFFTFMVLLTLDDDISHTHRSRISVF